MNSNYKIKYDKYKLKYFNLKKEFYGSGKDDYSEIIQYLKKTASNIDSYFNSVEYLSKFGTKLDDLIVDLDINTIKVTFNDNKYLQLRKYNGEKKLLIGCGNYRLDDRGGNPFVETEYSSKIHENKYHSHRDFFTIDLCLYANPSIVSTFDNNNKIIYTTIPDNSFDLIIFEGGGELNPDEIKRLLNKNTNSYCIYYLEKKTGIPYVYSYVNDGSYINNFEEMKQNSIIKENPDPTVRPTSAPAIMKYDII
jgi:hypothetical protein